MARSTVHYADNTTNNLLKRLHNKLRPAGTPVQRVEYIIELLLLRIFEVKLKQDPEFAVLRGIFRGENEELLFSALSSVPNEQILPTLNSRFFPFYARILSEARKVITGNPNIKVQDQLVLIEEVFSNSNFSNNVQSGNMREIIGFVGELDEDRLLKTDLLGDAIESALSETGGTRDIGLHRTPDHIRHFMVGLATPSFADRLFDPTAGTGGFLFDGFEFVMETVRRDGSWPGPRTHPELAEWFKKWFHEHPVAMPSFEVSTDFYRQGVSGIEYLGMIRKMAAINFYIRGLNPGNIMQGDALALFKKKYFPESASVILANPPFGAERDQEAYPDVWAEYPKESETTILFVKLMLEALMPGQRCAVIVSEGFMTWDQNSARALRKSLLDEADLRAIISLPQGVFVSKNGQGPKTSILYFEKPPKGTPVGQVTRHVWFYKVTNDGYTMGSNRKLIPGCQLVEALDLFHQYVRQGKTPPDTRHSFTVPAAWIRTLDPRIRERIRTETTAEITAKAEEDRAKLIATLEGRVTGGKLTSADMNDRLAQHEQLWSNKLSNEIAKRIERAHLYSWNLPNYRSSLTQEQRDAWTRYAADRISEGEESLDSWWQRIQTAKAEELPELLSRLDPTNALELDLARQRLAGIDSVEFQKNSQLNLISEILASVQKNPQVPLGEILRLKREVLKAGEYDGAIDIIGKIRFEDGKIFLREDRQTASSLQFTEKGNLIISKINFHQGATAVNDVGRVLASLDYLIYEVDRELANPKFVFYLLRHAQFLSHLEENKPGGVKGRSQPDFIDKQAIPLPNTDEQERTVNEIERLQSIADGADLLLSKWRIVHSFFSGSQVMLQDIADIGTGTTPPRAESKYFGGSICWALTTEVDENEIFDTREKLTEEAIADCSLRIYPENTILVAMYGQGKTRGKAAFLRCPAAITQNCAGIVITSPNVLPKYVYYFLRSIYDEIRGQEYSGAGVPHLNLSIMGGIKIPLPAREIQEEIVRKIDADVVALNEVRRIGHEASEQITTLIHNVWEH